MKSKEGPRQVLYLALVGLVAILWVVGLFVLDLKVPALTLIVRFLALAGYYCIFVSVVSSAYTRELVRAFGRPFIQVHHIVSIAGLVLIGLHPVMAALDFGSLSVFVPTFRSLYDFFLWGGRPAWYLVGLAALAAALRKRMVSTWRTIHDLNYIAFLLGTVHANLLGGNLQFPVPRALSILMALIVVGVFVQRRLQAAQRRKKS